MDLGSIRQRHVLAALLLSAGAAVSLDELIHRTWGEKPPGQARNSLYTYLSRLRAVGVPILRRRSGYAVIDGEVDVQAFRHGIAESRQSAGQDAFDRLASALAIWRAKPFAELDTPWFDLQRECLGQERLEAELAYAGLALQLAHTEGLVDRLTQVGAEFPLDERAMRLLMLALRQSGRPAEAIACYHRFWERLSAELGIDPSQELQQLHTQLLRDTAAEPPGDIPPPSPVPQQLPAPSRLFAGRSDELKELDELAVSPLVVISGPGGCGKTELALQWARLNAAAFPDGQLYVNLHGFSQRTPVPPASALSRLLRGLGVSPKELPLELEELTCLLRSMLAGRRLLLLVDDVPDAASVRPLLPGASPSTVLVTSRHSLNGLVAREGAARLNLGQMPEDEALDLLTASLGQSHHDHDKLAELAGLCGHLPLALRIAAANLTERPHRTIGEYVAELRQGDRLTALTVEGDTETAVQATFLASYERLPAQAKALFRRLSVLSGADFTAAHAAALLGADAGAALSSLLSAYLVQGAPQQRFTLHDLMRLCAAQRLQAEETGCEPEQRLLDWLLRSAVNAVDVLRPQIVRLPTPAGHPDVAPLTFESPEQAGRWLDDERANLIATIAEIASRSASAYSWLIADTLRGYFWLRPSRMDWQDAAYAGLAAALAAGDRLAAAAMHHCLGDAAWSGDDYPTAVLHLTKALEILRETNDPARQIAVLINLGLVHHEAGRIAGAESNLADAARICRELGDEDREADVLGRLGAVYTDLGRLEDAIACLLRAAHRQLTSGTRYRYAGVAGNLGIALRHQDRLAEAQQRFQEAVDIYREVGNRRGEACMLEELATTYLGTGDLDRAIVAARRAHTIGEALADQRVMAEATITLGLAGGMPDARDAFLCGLELARSARLPHAQITALLALASLGEDDAVDHARAAHALAQEMGYVMLANRAEKILRSGAAQG